MANAKRDDNNVTAIIGVSSLDGVTPTRARVDPVTGYLLMKLIVIPNFTTTSPRPQIDDNGKRVGCGVTNDASQTIKPFLVDTTNKNLLIQTT